MTLIYLLLLSLLCWISGVLTGYHMYKLHGEEE
jgi:hypothetical protein